MVAIALMPLIKHTGNLAAALAGFVSKLSSYDEWINETFTRQQLAVLTIDR